MSINMFKKKENWIPWDRVVQIKKSEYTYLKIIPDKSIRNYNSSNIVKAIAYTYKSLDKRLKFECKKLWFEPNLKISYVIDITKDNAEFIFIVPKGYIHLLKDKIREIWNKATIEEIEGIKPFSNSSIYYQLIYKKEDALSLKVDKKTNETLNGIIPVMEFMKDDDRITIIYNFLPRRQHGWLQQYEDTMIKIKEHRCIEKDKLSSKYILKTAATTMASILDSIMEILSDFLGGSSKKQDLSLLETVATVLEHDKELTSTTKRKKELIVVNTQMVVVSGSEDLTRKENNALSICQSYRSLDEDNELNYKKVNTKIVNVDKYKFNNISTNCISCDEGQGFVQIPGRHLLEEYKINHINTLESEVPKELKEGTKTIGISTYKGISSNVHLTTDKDYKNLAVAIIGPTRSGKTSLLGNMARDSIAAGECVIVLDYIENCGLSEDIKACIPKNKILEVELSDPSKLEGLGYNEAIKDTDDLFYKYESAKQQASQVITLVNAINIANSDFTPKMERYLMSACLVSFVSRGAIRDVIRILQDHKVRHGFIYRVPEGLKEYLQEYVDYLKELDDWSKETKDNPSEIVGTKTTNIVGILDRFSKLKQNTYMELMLKKDIKDNFNLYKEMEKNQCIFIKMPESMFSTADERDVMTTYWLTKIWISGQVRAWDIKNRYMRKTVTVITDEIAQLESAERFLGSKLDQTAKFGIKFIISTMYINQLKIKEKLRTANTSYIFISGADKNNFKEMKEEFEEKGFELEDMQKLKRYHSLNYLKYEGGYWAGITKLPRPVNEKD